MSVFIDANTEGCPARTVTPFRVLSPYVLMGTFGRTPELLSAGSPLTFAGRVASILKGREAECTSTEPGWVPPFAVTT
jgi:hypothetical protein